MLSSLRLAAGGLFCSQGSHYTSLRPSLLPYPLPFCILLHTPLLHPTVPGCPWRLPCRQEGRIDSLGKADAMCLLCIDPADSGCSSACPAWGEACSPCKHTGRCDLQAKGLKVICKIQKREEVWCICMLASCFPCQAVWLGEEVGNCGVFKAAKIFPSFQLLCTEYIQGLTCSPLSKLWGGGKSC